MLADLVKAGKIRHIGLSNESAWGTMRFLQAAEKLSLPRVVSIQNAYSPLGQGMLTGKYRGGARPAGSRWALFDRQQRYQTPGAEAAAETYFKLVEELSLTPTELALAFVHSRPFVTSMIIGATNLDQLAQNIDAAEIELGKEAMDRLNTVYNVHSSPCR